MGDWRPSNLLAPFGENSNLTGTIFGFTGQRFDREIGLYNYKARYYDPAIGRFLQPDPLGYAGGDLNLYAYVGNDPLNKRDPFGLSPDVDATISWFTVNIPEIPSIITGLDWTPPIQTGEPCCGTQSAPPPKPVASGGNGGQSSRQGGDAVALPPVVKNNFRDCHSPAYPIETDPLCCADNKYLCLFTLVKYSHLFKTEARQMEVLRCCNRNYVYCRTAMRKGGSFYRRSWEDCFAPELKFKPYGN